MKRGFVVAVLVLGLAEFHEIVIGGGNVPLDVLDDLVAAWIADS